VHKRLVNPMKKISILAISIVAGSYLVVCAALYIFQSSFIYFPQPRAIQEPGSTLILDNRGERIVVTVLRLGGPKALIYFGGNAEDASQNLAMFTREFPHHSIYLMHYRGYGGSSGTPSEAGLVADAVALFDSVSRGHSEISVVGRSLGSGVAVQVANGRPVAKLVLITPYASVAGVAAAMFPYVPVRLLLKDRFESEKYVKGVQAKTLILAAENDSVIPEWSTKALQSAFGKDKVFYTVISGSDHNSLVGKPQYFEALKAFLK
jgi:uncharacterized protein